MPRHCQKYCWSDGERCHDAKMILQMMYDDHVGVGQHYDDLTPTKYSKIQ